MKKIIFGGTFDPVHYGHLITARAVAEAVGAGRVILVPTGINPLKPPPAASDDQRLEMLSLATGGDALFEISDVELRRDGPHYTVDTVEQLIEQQGPAVELSVVIGVDTLADLPDWHRATDLLDMATIIVACRPPHALEEVRRGISALGEPLNARQVASLSESAVATPLIDISSTQIRRRVAAGLSIRYLTPQTVQAYISENKLYAEDTTAT
ncbi:MAG: nicotinate (nicotinamide) nucleotide adenylyltransferase [Phycisphaerae bacterium]|nr:nicotinate (nicotinamide) nucleotide adenylyltransferase [Phycisphaerae bacterium]